MVVVSEDDDDILAGLIEAWQRVGGDREHRMFASHRLDIGHVRTILGHYVRTGDASLLRLLADAAEASQHLGVIGAPPAFFAFGERRSRLTTSLSESMPPLSSSGFSVWLWLRWEGPSTSAAGSSAGAQAETHTSGVGPHGVLELLGVSGHGVQLLLSSGVLTVRVLSSKGGCSEVQASSQHVERRPWVEHADRAGGRDT
mgnify:CR=1 FL=1|jgi:hypothetical protein